MLNGEPGRVKRLPASKQSAKMHPLALLGVLLLLGGVGAWIWSGDWRLGVSGLLLMLGLATVAGFARSKP